MKTELFNFFRKRPKTNENHEQVNNVNIQEDYVTECIGSIGLYQSIVCTVAGLPRLISIWNLLSIMFLTPATDFICVEFKSDFTEEVQNSTCYKNCVRYEYSSSIFESTLISRFNLICESAWLAGFTQTSLMLGVLIGSGWFGSVSDGYGRMFSLKITTFFNIVFMVGAIYSPDYWTFTALRMLVGVMCGGIFVNSGVYILEAVGSKHKEAAGTWAMIPDAIAEAVLPIFAYYSSTWQMFLTQYCIASAVIFILIIKLPESPRWLIANGKTENGIEILTLAAKWNKLDTANIQKTVKDYVERIKLDEAKLNSSPLDLFRTKDLALKTICIILLFVEAGVGFFGINQYISLLENNTYISVALMGLIQIPASLLAIVFNKHFGRRVMITSVFLITATSMLIVTFLPSGHWTVIAFGVIGCNSINIAYIILYIYVAELFPTSLRNTALGVGSTGSKIGAMVTPFIAVLKPNWVPSVILAVIPCIISSVCLLLPETKGLLLKDTD